jgi:NAD(P)-dependent dehydrogenase (short-subunit alcohol dehydrogenase family)
VEFSDRNIVVTGGTGALGTAVVDAFVALGAICHIPHRDDNRATRPQHRQARLYSGIDLSDETAVDRLFAAVGRPWASIHIAGGFAAAAVSETSKKDFAHQIDMNLTTSFLCCRAAVRAMMQSGGGGRIVNVAARPALEWRAGAGMAAYTASKAAVAAFTAALAEEVVKHGILVNAVAPSIMDTPANRQAMPKAKHEDWPKVEEVAKTILFLASPQNKVTRGAIVPVYGRI